MKRVLLLTFALVSGNQLMAAEGINSKVIHDYTELGVAYNYTEIAGGTAHGVIAHTSVDMSNILFDVNGGYNWGEGELEFWEIGGGIGYAVRLMRNYINIIPRFGMAYGMTEIGPFEDSVTTIQPGITLSFAINNRLSVAGNYTYVRALDNNEEDAHTFGPSARFAITPTIGIDGGARFRSEGQAFFGAFGGVSFHF